MDRRRFDPVLSPVPPQRGHFVRCHALIAVLIALAAGARAEAPSPAAAATSDPAAPASGSAAAVERTDAGPVPVARDTTHAGRRASPLHAALKDVLAREANGLIALRARLAQTRDHAQAIAIQREIRALKRETEISLLRAQAEAARREGRAAVLAEIESELALMLRPPVPAPTAARPSPSAAARRAN